VTHAGSCYLQETRMVQRPRVSHREHHFSVVGCRIAIFLFTLTSPLLLSSCAGPAFVDPVVEAKTAIERCDPFMGDWQGSWKLDDQSDSGPLAAHVIAQGKEQYRVVFFDAFDTRTEPLGELEGRLGGGKVSLTGWADSEIGRLDLKGIIEGVKFNGAFEGQGESGTFELTKMIRLSPTLGAEPPAGAIVLFNGKNLRQWEPTDKKPIFKSVKWKRTKDGAMEVKKGAGSIVTKKKFTDFKLHVEFRTPFMPDKRGQARGNSGVYLQGRYEVQVLDSYGLEGVDNECGGIYKVGRPIVNMCAPPMQWQTYDITFHAPRFDNSGAKTKDASVTIVHNGVTIHDERKIPGPTGGALDNNAGEPGGIYLQDHGNPVQFRNIWLVEL